jgi:N-acetyl-gamma-glutamyl-phosphate reductase
VANPSVFIDGAEGTTGLLIHERLAARPDIDVLSIDPALRKDIAARTGMLRRADVGILCLPDVASREIIGQIETGDSRIIDASTAFRVAEDWTYGLPELTSGQRSAIANASRVSVPGCHATGFVLAVRPLVEAGIIPPEQSISSFSLTGYSGGGKKLIGIYESNSSDDLAMAPYALTLAHKHLPEMQRYSGLRRAPIFQPVVGRLFRGMIVSVLFESDAPSGTLTAAHVHETLAKAYANESAVRVHPPEFEGALIDGMLSPAACNGTNRVDLFVVGCANRIEVLARLDNLGKGASGGAIQCLNLMLGRAEFEGLAIDGIGQ